jgi:hypothetical protein
MQETRDAFGNLLPHLKYVNVIHDYVLNQDDNGGEQVSIETRIEVRPDEDHCLNQTITIRSYGNEVNIVLGDTATLTPGKLRALANQLEQELDRAEQILKQRREALGF